GLRMARRTVAVTDPGRRSGRENVARPERQKLGEIGDELGHAEHQVPGVAVLPDLAVDLGPEPEIAGIRHLVAGDEPGTERGEAVGTLALGRAAAALHLRSEEHTSELQSRENLVCRLLLEQKHQTN